MNASSDPQRPLKNQKALVNGVNVVVNYMADENEAARVATTIRRNVAINRAHRGILAAEQNFLHLIHGRARRGSLYIARAAVWLSSDASDYVVGPRCPSTAE